MKKAYGRPKRDSESLLQKLSRLLKSAPSTNSERDSMSDMKLTPREPTPEMVKAERVKFEAWCSANGHGTLDDMMMPLDRALKNLLWSAWQARAMHDATPSVPSVEQELLEALALLLLETEDYPEVMPQTLRKARRAIARAKGE